ncbi:patatin-like phospholipase family protein [Basfia succiniciproducens]|uniref:NTE family protein n=1 Tax=Basfia succiniciproducens TaxID=653940 RepID=A0A1G5D5A6_9PAST|nr:patatin-like phospholipase family protein [Basfia succiniciproducens]QIM69324.1 patatin [Basfia succiniciproducens]SCY09844.1 NTE family protein [Basfia succiniciproducens]
MMLKNIFAGLTVLLLSACTLVTYQPVDTISHVNAKQGYRMRNAIQQPDGNLIILMFSGGGSRAASLGYGVLEGFKNAAVRPTAKGTTLIDNVDLVYGVSGGSVLATYYSLYGRDAVPKFEENFLKKNFQREIISQVFSLSNLPRITSPQFGRGDLLQEQLDQTLYKGATFGDLERKRKGPFVVVSATDMNLGQKITFTQEFFDGLCIDLSKMEISRAVAASSSVPLLFSPLTLNNNGGNCHFDIPELIQISQNISNDAQKSKNLEELKNTLSLYQNSKERPFIHLVDGGLTDNLGLSGLIDIYDVAGQEGMYREAVKNQLKNIIVINVNAQNEVSSEIDKTANVPGTRDVINTIINVPIDRNSQVSLRRFREFTDEWNKSMANKPPKQRINMHFVNLSLKDLPESQLKKEVLNISTSFYLLHSDVNKLKRSAKILLQQSKEYQDVLRALQ